MSENQNQTVQDIMGQWDIHFKRIKESELINVADKEFIVERQKKLIKVFDDKWFWDNTAQGFTHPLAWQFDNIVPISQSKLAELGSQIDAIKHLKGFESISNRLKNTREYYGAVAEVEIIAKLISSGFTDVELSKTIFVHGKSKAPDIRAGLNGEEIYCEITGLQDSQEIAKATKAYNGLMWPHDPEIIMYCQIYKILSEPRTKELKSKIQSAISEVSETREYRYIHEPRVLDCLIIHPRLREQAKSLAEKFNMKAELTGPPVPIDDVRQLKHALKAKSHQLPPDKPGIIVIFTNLVFFGSTEEFYKEVVYQVEDEVYDIPNLVACSVVNQMSMLSSKTIFEDQPNYTLFRKSVDGLTGETILTIKNKYSPYKDMAISKKIIDVLSKS